jgi:hypothetical protein
MRVIIETNGSISGQRAAARPLFAFLWPKERESGVESSPLLRAGACHLGAYAAAPQFCGAALDGIRRALPVAVVVLIVARAIRRHYHSLFYYLFFHRSQTTAVAASNLKIYCFIDT